MKSFFILMSVLNIFSFVATAQEHCIEVINAEKILEETLGDAEPMPYYKITIANHCTAKLEAISFLAEGSICMDLPKNYIVSIPEGDTLTYIADYDHPPVVDGIPLIISSDCERESMSAMELMIRYTISGTSQKMKCRMKYIQK